MGAKLHFTNNNLALKLSRQESWKYLSTENSSLSTLEENHDVAHGLKWEMKENFLYDESSGADSGPSSFHLSDFSFNYLVEPRISDGSRESISSQAAVS
ncbi:hypothetical protein LIER_44124 [Lithospermum erythrorhizon]|uniref:Uncharacterized protein n=1 Tax=Lithospermum erythrorhizon TaxID=34254 RepID=A0AAV3Q0A5_LITER